MEDTLGVRIRQQQSNFLSLNPCSNGRYSRREIDWLSFRGEYVLILVLMEDTLGDNRKK